MNLLAHVTPTELPMGVVIFVLGVLAGVALAGAGLWIGKRNR